MITVAEALGIIAKACPRAPEEAAALSEGLGRVLARDVRSDVDWPPFDTSAMDGYAVRLADAASAGAALRERPGLVAAGDRPAPPLEPGEAVRVMTGAPLPGGTEAVSPIEEVDVDREASRVRIRRAPRAGEHIRRRAESVVAGRVLLPAGRRLRAADIALAALAGADPIPVRRRPRIAIAVTGNELVPASATPGPGQLRDSNGPMLAALCLEAGCPATRKPPVPDEDEAVRHLFAEAGRDEDLLVTSGGVSAGDLDLLPGFAESGGFEILFHGVAVRPGRPTAFGRKGASVWFGLPGNPVSASVCFRLFVRTALDAIAGVEPPGPVFSMARLTRDLAVRGRRETYRDALLQSAGGERRVTPAETLGSHDLATHARANALIRIPADAERLPAGSLVECLLLTESA